MNKIKELFSIYTDKVTDDFIAACEKGDLFTIKKLVNKYPKDNHRFLNKGLIAAQNDLKTVEYLMTSLDLKNHAKINFLTACEQRHLGLVTYLSNSTSNLPPFYVKQAFFNSCKYGNLDVVKHLLTHPTKEIINFSSYSVQEQAFFAAYNNDQKHVVEYLIFDEKIKLTREIRRIRLRDVEIDNMFASRRLKQELEEELAEKPNLDINKVKRIKI